MSQWTHVNAQFRIDGIRLITPIEEEDEAIYSVFGRHVGYEDRYFYEGEYKSTPMGSEGSLDIEIWHNPNKSHLASTKVSVFGDLRDYGGDEEIEALKNWFEECCSSFYIRQAVMQVEDEYENDDIVFIWDIKSKKAIRMRADKNE